MIAAFLYRNPRVLLLVIAVLVAAGLSSFLVMPRLEDPVLGKRVAVISTIFPGADAQRVESLVTVRLEETLQGIAQIKEVRSNSRTGISNIVVKLTDATQDVDAAWADVRDRLEDIGDELPAGSLSPSFEIFPLKAYAAIVAVQWRVGSEENISIHRKLAAQLRRQISNLPGTESVDVFGDPGQQILVEASPTVLAATGLSTASIAAQVSSNLATRPAGIVRSSGAELLIDLKSADSHRDALAQTAIRFGPRGDTALLADLASIAKAAVDPAADVALIDGRRAIVLGAFFDDSQRLDHWATRLDDAIAKFQSDFASEVAVDVIFSQQSYIESRLRTLLRNLMLGAAGVAGVVLVLMGWRSMLVVAATLPLSCLMVLAGMRFLNIPMHQMSITGLILALGLLIDNAIVMVEDMRARIIAGRPVEEAIRGGIRHLAMPLFGSTVTTALAFTPIATLPGPPGEFVGTLAVSVILAIGSSLLLAMTVVPALLGIMGVRQAGTGLLANGITIPLLTRAYRWSLTTVFRYPLLGVCLGATLPAIGFRAAPQLPEQFFPASDRNQIQIELELPARSPLDKTLATVQAIRRTVEARDEVGRTHWFVGRSAPTFYYNVIPSRRGTPFYAQAIVDLDQPGDPERFVRSLQDELNAEHAACRCLVRQLEQGPPFDAPIEVRLVGPDLATLQQLGSQLRRILSQTPNVVHTRSDAEETIPKLMVDVDRGESIGAGTTDVAISQFLYTTLEGAAAGTLVDGEEELPVVVRMERQDERRLQRAAALQLFPRNNPRPNSPSTGPSATPSIPLGAIADFRLDSDVAAVVRINGERTNEVKAYLTAGVLPAVVLDDFQQRLASSGFRLPLGYRLDFGGESAERTHAVTRLMANAGLIVALMVLTLVAAFRSFRSALIIAIVGGLTIGLGMFALWWFRYPFGFMAIVGTMGLVGVAINDSIVVLAAIRENQLAQQGNVKALTDVVNGCTRHIVATTVTTIAGFLPLIVAGGRFWPPLAITIAGGVGGATFLALYFAPSMHRLLHRSAARVESR